MKRPTSRLLLAVLTAILVGFSGQLNAQEQAYPSRPITIVVAFPPGGVVDLLARSVGSRLSKALNQSVVIENRAGATGKIGTVSVAKAAPDGYTLLLGQDAAFAINPHLDKQLGYALKDFAVVSGLVSLDLSLIAAPSLPVNNLNDVIKLAKQKPGELTLGTFGLGSTSHLYTELLNRQADIKVIPVHYRGATPALNDLLGGHVSLTFLVPGTMRTVVNDNKAKLVATGGKTRMPDFPNAPTISETLNDFEPLAWFGLFAPANTPPAIIAKLNGEVRKIFADPEFQTSFMKPQLFNSMAGPPAEFEKFIQAEAQKFGEVIQRAGIKAE